MKKTTIVIFLVFYFQLPAQIMWQFNSDTVVTWYYQEGDEFNDVSVNTNYWNYIIWARSLYMNREQQYYTDGKNHEVQNGVLKLKARKETFMARTVDGKGDLDSLFAGKKFFTLNKTNYSYTSGRLTSKGTFNKGFFECRFKLPPEKGYWPAFWLHGGAPNEEIDILEAETVRPHDIHVDTHCPDHCDMVWRNLARESFGAWIKTRYDFSKDFNVIACEWDQEYVKYFLNGEFIAISKVNFNISKHLTVNLAVPSDKGPFGPGPQGADTTATFEVDYIRVWSKKSVEPTGTVLHTDFQNADTSEMLRNSPQILNRGRSFYGNKKDAKREGIKITLVKDDEDLKFTVLGNSEGESPGIKISDLKEKSTQTYVLDRTFKSIKLSDLKEGDQELTITWNNKNVVYRFKND